MKDFSYYLQLKSLGPEVYDLSNNDFAEACICGYIAALRKTHAYNTVLFENDDECIREQISKQIKTAYQDISSISSTNHSAISAILFTCHKLLTDENSRYDPYYPDSFARKIACTRDTVHPLLATFIRGYFAALHVSKKYDYVIELKGHQLQAQIASDLLTMETKHENAARAAARIIMRRYCNMIFDTDTPLDDDNPITK